MKLYKNTFQYQTSIIKILNVDIMHNYFEDGIFKKYEIQPNLETLNLLKNYNLIFKKTETGFVILFQKEKRFFSENYSDELKLIFKIKILDSNFLSYTNLPYSSSLNLSLNNSDDRVELHEGDFVNKTSLSPPYEAGINGTIGLTINKSNEIFNESNKYKSKNFFIKFDSRDVKFRYNFITEEDININSLYLTNDNKSLKYTDFKKRTLSTGKEVLSILIDQSVKLKERFNDKWFLHKSDDMLHEHMIFLPNPNVDKIYYDKSLNIFINDMYCNI